MNKDLYRILDPCKVAERRAQAQADRIKFIMTLAFMGFLFGMLFASCHAIPVLAN